MYSDYFSQSKLSQWHRAARVSIFLPVQLAAELAMQSPARETYHSIHLQADVSSVDGNLGTSDVLARIGSEQDRRALEV